MASQPGNIFVIWKGRMRCNKKGVPYPNLSNAVIILANDPELRGMLSKNELSHRVMLLRAPPLTADMGTQGAFPRELEEDDCATVLAYLQEHYNHLFRLEPVRQAMLLVAAAAPSHPIRDYLDSLRWDQVPRIGHWLDHAFGAPISPYHHAIGMKFLQAAVRRVRHPGCKFDFMLILEGKEAIGKSRGIRALFGDDWFSDSLPADLNSRHAQDAIQGLWGIEFAEIVHLLTNKPEVMKGFLSRQSDRYLAPYGHATMERPRQCVFVGTTNDDNYALGATGNRRLWPCQCEFVNVEWITENRDQLWAEAAISESQALLFLDDRIVESEAVRQQEARQDADPWAARVLQYAAAAGSYVRIPDILTTALEVPVKDQEKRDEMRVGAILKRAGYSRELKWLGGVPKNEWRWNRPAEKAFE